MENHEITFPLNKIDQLILQMESPLNKIFCCSEANIIFNMNNTSYTFGIHNIEDHMEDFSKQLTLALNNKIFPHKLGIEDIGYNWNEACHNKPDILYSNDSLRIWTAGNIGELCLSAWIYNDQNGSIVLEITPDYPWYQCETESEAQKYPHYVPYKEWIKNYNPLIKRIIPKDIAQKWLEQARHIAHVIGENIEKMSQPDNH